MVIFFLVLLAVIIFALVIKYPLLSIFLYLTTSFVKPLLLLHVSIFQTIDYTVICGILVLISMSYNFIKMKGNVSDIMSIPVLLYFALAVLLLFGILYTSAPKYGFQKGTRFMVLSAIAFLSPLFLGRDMKSIRRILMLLILIGLTLSLGTIVAPHASVLRLTAETRGSFLESSPLETANMIATAALICFCLSVHSSSSKTVKFMALLMVPLFLAAIIISGSRGPFVGLGISILVAFFVLRGSLSGISIPIVVMLLISSLFIIIIKLPEADTKRIMSLFSGQQGVEELSSGRTYLYKFVFTNFTRHPLTGHGTGAYAFDYTGVDEPKYPHNILLELLYENGILGILLFMGFMGFIYRKWKLSRDILRVAYLEAEKILLINICGLLVFYTLIQAMKSSDIEGNRFMFFCCGLVLGGYRAAQSDYYQNSAYSIEESGYPEFVMVPSDEETESELLY